MEFDLLISGAGPAGLCLARALADTGLTIGLVEQQPEEALREAAFDGREIALTQRSASLMRELGLWKRIQDVDGAAFSPLRDARVFNGSSPFAMLIGHTLTNRSELGWLVSNHHIRRAAYAEVKAAAEEHGRITLMTGQPITRVLVRIRLLITPCLCSSSRVAARRAWASSAPCRPPAARDKVLRRPRLRAPAGWPGG